ncbi:MAG: hypothetical protein R3246_17570, partial [Acidimicrobiia bacterium]|nr:hypothetical protein [Acidimicrobiia bacterium]
GTHEDLVVVEPYLEGTTTPMIVSALAGRLLRLTAVGVQRLDARSYGSRRDHERAHGLDAAAIRRRLTEVGVDGVRRSGSRAGRLAG